MRITAKLSVIIAAIFAVICFGVAITGFRGTADITDPVLRSDSLGYAWFWTFLGSVAVVFGAIGLWLMKSQTEDDA